MRNWTCAQNGYQDIALISSHRAVDIHASLRWSLRQHFVWKGQHNLHPKYLLVLVSALVPPVLLPGCCCYMSNAEMVGTASAAVSRLLKGFAFICCACEELKHGRVKTFL